MAIIEHYRLKLGLVEAKTVMGGYAEGRKADFCVFAMNLYA
jgi:hypothetical protein